MPKEAWRGSGPATCRRFNEAAGAYPADAAGLPATLVSLRTRLQ